MNTKYKPVIFESQEEAQVVLDELREWGYEDDTLIIEKRNFQGFGNKSADEAFVIVRKIKSPEPYSNAQVTEYLRENSVFE